MTLARTTALSSCSESVRTRCHKAEDVPRKEAGGFSFLLRWRVKFFWRAAKPRPPRMGKNFSLILEGSYIRFIPVLPRGGCM